MALMGKMAVNDRAESSFASITAQIQEYGRIGLANGAAISNMGRNGFLDRPLTKTDLKGQKRGVFYSLSKIASCALSAWMQERYNHVPWMKATIDHLEAHQFLQ